jgi:hypothetical protein
VEETVDTVETVAQVMVVQELHRLELEVMEFQVLQLGQ